MSNAKRNGVTTMNSTTASMLVSVVTFACYAIASATTGHLDVSNAAFLAVSLGSVAKWIGNRL